MTTHSIGSLGTKLSHKVAHNLILRYVPVIFILFLKQILGIIIILIAWNYVLQDIFVDLEMTGMVEVMFRAGHQVSYYFLLFPTF